MLRRRRDNVYSPTLFNYKHDSTRRNKPTQSSVCVSQTTQSLYTSTYVDTQSVEHIRADNLLYSMVYVMHTNNDAAIYGLHLAIMRKPI